ncbi:hypothetical protein [Sneathiella sp.]|uniref:hypothetical protein n=1 Tax=Sneathiella sp. TaxID=1964365 RepID=UPI0025DC3705|nr:hypothetical protein [Sneathiella sp.]
MSTESLAIGNPEEGENDHALLDKIDISEYRPIEQFSAKNLGNTKNHHRKNGQSGNTVQKIFEFGEAAVKRRERRTGPRTLREILSCHDFLL